VLVVHGTKKFLDRVGKAAADAETPSTTALGSWFATALFWQPQIALFVNVRTLIPVFMPLAPAKSVVERFGEQLDQVLTAHEVERSFIDHELAEMATSTLAKINSRSVLGSMNDFIFMAESGRERGRDEDLLSLSVQLAHTPCGPLRDRTGWPDLELRALVADFNAARSGAKTHLRLVE
jgi:hypothetical protein